MILRHIEGRTATARTYARTCAPQFRDTTADSNAIFGKNPGDDLVIATRRAPTRPTTPTLVDQALRTDVLVNGLCCPCWGSSMRERGRSSRWFGAFAVA